MLSSTLPWVQIALALQNMAFFALFAALSWHNRLAGDDFLFRFITERYGVLGCVSFFWHRWTGRWFSTYFLALFGPLIEGRGLFFYNLLSLLCLALVLWFLLVRLQSAFLAFAYPSLLLSSVAFFLAEALFLIGGSQSDVWFWYAGSATYLWPLTFALLAAALLIKRDPPSWSVVLASVLLAFVAGSNETYALICGGILFAVLFVNYAHHRSRNLSRRRSLRHLSSSPLVWPLLACLISGVIVVLAPGNAIRRSFFEDVTLSRGVYLIVRSTGWTFSHFINDGLRSTAVLLTLMLAGLLGRLAADRGGFRKAVPVGRVLKLAWGSVVVLVALSVTPFALSYHSYPPNPRVLGMAAAAFIGACFLSGFVVAAVHGKAISARGIVAIATLFLLVGSGLHLSAYSAYYPLAARYSAAYDERREHLLRLNRRTPPPEVVELDPLPPSGWLVKRELTEDPFHWLNLEWKRGLDLRYDVKLKDGYGAPISERDRRAHRRLGEVQGLRQ